MTKFWISCIALAPFVWPAWGQKVEVEKLDQKGIVHVQTALNHLTVLEMSGAVTTVAVGSPSFKVEWRENRVFIEPTEPEVATNLFVWTPSGRFNYELDAAGAVPEMVFAIDQPIADPPKINASANRVAQSIAPSPLDILIATKPIRLLGESSARNSIAVYVTDWLEQDGQMLIRYSIHNGTTKTYVPGEPRVVVLKAARYHESLYTLKNSQLGSGQTHRLKSSGEIPVEVTKCAGHSLQIEPGSEWPAIVAIKLIREQTQPTVIRLVFLGSSNGPVSATLVL